MKWLTRMKWLNDSKEDDEVVNYWQTISDVLSALLLILLLINMLLIMYVVLVPENDNLDIDEGNVYDSHDWDNEFGWATPTPSPTVMPTPTPTPDWNHGGGGGGGGGDDGEGDGDGEGDYEFSEQGISEYEGLPKAAVYVKVLDGETRRLIREEGVTFTVLDRDRKQLKLDTHYPQQISFTEFATTEFGVFFLPEKILVTDYTLREKTEPEGYDGCEDIDFSIDEEHEWDEPYIIEVELFPSRNVIRVRNVDSVTGEPVEGGVYDVYAAEDIITNDGTLRYTVGSKVDEIICGAEGVGESQELFLGLYSVVQRVPPEYYASILESTESHVVKKRESSQSSSHAMYCQRTKAILNVRDALYENITVPGAAFQVKNLSGTVNFEVVSDEKGQIVLDELAKNTTYSVRQLTSAEGYRHDGEELQFTVGEDGRIDGETSTQMDVQNRTIRLSVSVRDAVLRNQVSDYSVSLLSQSGDVVKLWTSSASAEVISGLNPETYTIVVDGSGAQEREITLNDTVQIQHVAFYVWTNGSILLVSVLAVVAVGGLALAIAVRRRKKRNGK